MKDESGSTYFKEYWDHLPAQLTIMQKIVLVSNGKKRRKEYIKKHPPEKCVDPAPSGWDEPMQPKKRRRRK